MIQNDLLKSPECAGTAYGSANALVTDLVPEQLRGTAYGTYNAVINLLTFPSSLIAGILWGGHRRLARFWPFRTFFLWWAMALLAAILWCSGYRKAS